MKQPLRVVIGYDKREDDAYTVCRHSLMRHSSIPLHINRLDIRSLKAAGLYTRPYTTNGGQMIDERDGRPFSTEFAFSRFLVPALTMYDGWAVFCDCDFLFTADIAEVTKFLDPSKAVMVVKHDHIPQETVKMDGVSQGSYPRKNWSSFILWNNAHPANRMLDLHEVNHKPGKWLHGFGWLRDDQIGELPAEWNWLAGVNDPVHTEFAPAAIHYTLGIPSMPGHEDAPYAEHWRYELNLATEGNHNGQQLHDQEHPQGRRPEQDGRPRQGRHEGLGREAIGH